MKIMFGADRMSRIFLSHTNSPDDKNLIKFLDYFDLKYTTFNDCNQIPSGASLFLNCNSFHNDGNIDCEDFPLTRCFLNVFLYNISHQSIASIQHLTNTTFDLEDVNEEIFQFEVSAKEPKICRQLTGLTYLNKNQKIQQVFRSIDPEVRPLIFAKKRLLCLYIQHNTCSFFADANESILDVDQKVTSVECNISEYFVRLAPILMFCKYALFEHMWHPNEHFASLIIDDPLLRKNYGFLNYERLLALMDRLNFCSNIAFIPYNYRRTDDEIISMFAKRGDKLSLSIHGCDHTEEEYGNTNEDELNRQTLLALSRMEKLKTASSLDYGKIMVFPQGSFSSASVKILKANNFMGAINSTIQAHDMPEIPISSFLGPAMTGYFSFPIFDRCYTGDLADAAFTLFLDKPLFFVEHHDYFKNNDFFVSKFFNSLDKQGYGLNWKSPQYILQNFNLSKKKNGKKVLQVFTNEAIVTNPSKQLLELDVLKKDNKEIPIREILVDGEPTDYRLCQGYICISLKLQPQSKSRMNIIYQNNIGISKRPGPVGVLKIFLRRYLTEVRDNYISKNDFLLLIASKTKSLIKKLVT